MFWRKADSAPSDSHALTVPGPPSTSTSAGVDGRRWGLLRLWMFERYEDVRRAVTVWHTRTAPTHMTVQAVSRIAVPRRVDLMPCEA